MADVKKHTCVVALKDRVEAGLFNLAGQRERGEELAALRAAEYASKKEMPRIEVEWSASETDVEDDVPLDVSELRFRPSRRWEESHMVKIDDQFNQERKDNSSTVRKMRRNGGSFSANADGRYHQQGRNKDVLASQHTARTAQRRLCKRIGSGHCKYEFMCTLRHIETDRESQQRMRAKNASCSKAPWRQQ